MADELGCNYQQSLKFMLDSETLENRQIGLPHQDPTDRFIVATALYYGLQLATVDAQLTGLAELPTVS
ncbi:hypothetical protein [Synechococcus sp. PCC 6312]|uniref:hypothetical protein n=1 Tax=Synechococcus sp. (strain ATCC 27167 / PCC 6312) TaxID=195253 RepID=UPI00031907FD|nr:hypothetical protein [Synechococcus sp. PCC 6312]